MRTEKGLLQNYFFTTHITPDNGVPYPDENLYFAAALVLQIIGELFSRPRQV